MKTRTYDDLCKTCMGTGMMKNYSFNPNVTDSEINVICVVCKGTGVVRVTELETEITVQERIG